MTLQDYLTWFDEVVGPTDEMMKMVPEDRLDWKLTEKSFTLGQLLAHFSRSFLFNAQVIRGDELSVRNIRQILLANRREPSMTVPEAVSQLTESTAVFKSAVLEMGEERFQSGFIETPQKGRVPAWRFVFFILEHHIHHLMELHLCLKVLGLKVHTGTLYRVPQGWSGGGGENPSPSGST